MEKPQSLLKWAEHNKATTILLSLALVVSILFMGCQPKGASILKPDTMVTLPQLQSEAVQVQADFDVKLKQLEISKAEIERKMVFRAKIIELAGSVGQLALDGTLSPTAGLFAGLQLLTLAGAGGLAIDNRKKNKLIAANKTKATKK